MAEYTDIVVLLDRSGSMESIKSAMESAFEEFVLQHRAVPTSRLTLIQFDSNDPQEIVFTSKPITDAPKLNLRPRGGTPLLDAFCRAIDGTGKRLSAMGEAERPDQVLFVIITDGQENQSREFTREDVRERVTKQSSIYKWQFVYLGANQDAFAEAASFGISLDTTLAYAASSAGTRSMGASLGHNTAAYAKRASMGPQAFTRAQRAGAMVGDKKRKPKVT